MKKKIINLSASAVLSTLILAGCGAGNETSIQTKEAATVQEAQYKEGIHYTILENPIEAPVNSVTEIFSFACPHCYNAEQNLMSEWKSESEGKTDFILYHSTAKIWEADALVFYTLKKMERLDLFNDYFSSRQNKEIVNEETFYKFLEEHKVNKVPYDKISGSQMVKDEIIKASAIEKQVAAGGVPAFVVSGKYLINLRGIKTFKDVKSISEFLLTKKP